MWGSIVSTTVENFGEWPVAFSDTPAVSAYVVTDNAYSVWFSSQSNLSNVIVGKGSLCRGNDLDSPPINAVVYFLAFGRWSS